jgi:large subunit ribosomal protein L29
MRIKEIRGMNSEERTKRVSEFRTELLRLKTMIKAGGMVENPARIKHLRRTIARILTIEHEEKLKPEVKEAKAEPKKKEATKKKEKKAEKERKGRKEKKESNESNA